MKKNFFTLLIALPILMNAHTAKIKIDIDRTIGEIDPKIYGVFMEPIHFTGKMFGLSDTASFNTLEGNLYDPSSPLADENGFRKDYIEAMSELKNTNIRWPGGNFLMGYDWKDGIGPKNKRPTRINLAWGGLESNQVGTNEWFALNKAIITEIISNSGDFAVKAEATLVAGNTLDETIPFDKQSQYVPLQRKLKLKKIEYLIHSLLIHIHK